MDGKLIKEFKVDENERGKIWHLEVDNNNRILVGQRLDGEVKIFDKDGFEVLTFTENANDNNLNHLTRFNSDNSLQWPAGIAVDNSNNILIGDARSNSVQIYDENGKFIKYFIISDSNQPDWPYHMAINAQDNLVLDHHGNVTVVTQDGDLLHSFEISDVWDLTGDKKNRILAHTSAGNGLYIKIIDYDGKIINEFDASIHPHNGWPNYLTTDNEDLIVIGDVVYKRILIFDYEGNFISKFGEWKTHFDQFRFPFDAITDNNNRIIVADRGNNRIQIFGQSGNHLGQFGEYGSELGSFRFPFDIAVDGNNRIIVGDGDYNRIQIFNEKGEFIKSFYASSNYIAIDKKDRIILADNKNTIQIYDSDGEFIQRFGESGLEESQFKNIFGVATNSLNQLIIGDRGNNRIQIFDSEGNFVKQFNLGGDRKLNYPIDLDVYLNDQIIVSDRGTNKVKIFNSTGSLENVLDFESHYFTSDRAGNMIIGTNSSQIAIFNPEGKLMKTLG